MNKPYRHKISGLEQQKIERFIFWAALVTGVLALLIVLLIISAHRLLPLISLESERRFVEPYINLLANSQLKSSDFEVQSQLQQLADQITVVNPIQENFKLQVHYLKSDLPNAFATLGGHVFVTEGLIKSLTTENSLMMILAHETGHIVHRDPIVGMGRALLIEMLIYSATGSSGAGNVAANISSQLTLTRYSRDQEKASDLFALETLQQIYGHVGGAADFFNSLLEQEPNDDKNETMPGQLPEWFSTHPDLSHRIEYLHSTTKHNGWLVKAQRPYPPVLLAVLKNKAD